MSTLSPIAEMARLETAAETLAESIGYLRSEINSEPEQEARGSAHIAAAESEWAFVFGERRALKSSYRDIINRALYVYAPVLKRMYKVVVL